MSTFSFLLAEKLEICGLLLAEYLSVELNINIYKILEALKNFSVISKKEKWDSIINFPKYKISNYGKIKNIETSKILQPNLRNFYFRIKLIDKNKERKDKYVSHLVAEHFIPNPNNYKYVKHLDNNKSNNQFTNLKWVKRLEFRDKEFLGTKNEKWKIISGYSNYQVSDRGNVRNLCTKKFIKPGVQNGYETIHLYKDKKRSGFKIHRLVAQEFIENPHNKPTVDHIDRNRSNNKVSNLRWASSKEQARNSDWKGKLAKNDRQIWRINLDNENDRKLYDNMKDVVDFIIENNLSVAKRKYIISNLKKMLSCFEETPGTPVFSRYGYKWEYNIIENIEGEIWKKVKNIYPEANNYKISNMGRVKNNKGNLISGKNENGYNAVYLGKNSKIYKIHRLVAQLFLANPENKKIINHKDGNKLNNKASNLEFVTSSENNQHAMDTHLNPRSMKIRVLNLVTQKEFIYNSQKHASLNLQISTRTISKYTKNGREYNNMKFSAF
jgi:hypothetical protein